MLCPFLVLQTWNDFEHLAADSILPLDLLSTLVLDSSPNLPRDFPLRFQNILALSTPCENRAVLGRQRGPLLRRDILRTDLSRNRRNKRAQKIDHKARREEYPVAAQR